LQVANAGADEIRQTASANAILFMGFLRHVLRRHTPPILVEAAIAKKRLGGLVAPATCD
jgi:hypothetical protein